LETVTVECMLPHGVAAIIEYQTESKNRVLQDVRVILSKNGGTVTPTAFLFEKKGRIWFREQDQLGEDEVLEEAIEAGATEVTTEEGRLVVDTSPSDVSTVADQLQERFKLQVERAEIIFDPNEDSIVELSETQSQEVQRILDRVEEEPSFQSVYINASSD
jgi:transcriptional/translational regulatory protein YebC/TACO1